MGLGNLVMVVVVAVGGGSVSGLNFDIRERKKKFAIRTIDFVSTDILTRIPSGRQKMPLHRPHLYPWPYPDRYCRLDQDAPYAHHPPRIPPLHPQIQPLREAPQEPRGPCLPRIPCRGRRPGHRRPVQASVQDCLCTAFSGLCGVC